MVNLDIAVNWSANANQLNDVNNQVKTLSNGITSVGNRLGFMAFQWTFMAGIARRTLEEIKVLIDEVLIKGAEGQDALVRAVQQSIDLQPGLQDTTMQADKLTTAIYKLGSGATIFGVTEVANAFKDLQAVSNNSNQALELLYPTLKAMTIAGVDSADAAGKMAVMWKDWGTQVGSVDKLLNMLVQGTVGAKLNFDQLTSSLSQVDADAQRFHLTLAQTIALLQTTANSTNKSLQALGGLTAVGQVLQNMFTGLQTHTDSALKTMGRFGVELVNVHGQLRPFVDIIGTLRDHFQKLSTPAQTQLLAALGVSGEAAIAMRALLAQSKDSFNAQVDAINKSVAAQKLYQEVSNTVQANLAKMTNAQNALKMSIVAGLAPAIGMLGNKLAELAGNTQVMDMFKEIGTSISNALIPILNIAISLLTTMADVFAKNKAMIDFVSVAFLGLIGVLTLMLIVGTIAALVAALGSLLQKTLVIAALNASISVWRLAIVLILVLATIAFLGKAVKAFTDLLSGNSSDLTKTIFYSSLAALTGALALLLASPALSGAAATIIAAIFRVSPALIPEISAVLAGTMVTIAITAATIALGLLLGGALASLAEPFFNGLFGYNPYSEYDNPAHQLGQAIHDKVIAAMVALFIEVPAIIGAIFVGWAGQIGESINKGIKMFWTWADWVIESVEAQASKLKDAGVTMAQHIGQGIQQFFLGGGLQKALGDLWNWLTGSGGSLLPQAFGETGGAASTGDSAKLMTQYTLILQQKITTDQIYIATVARQSSELATLSQVILTLTLTEQTKIATEQLQIQLLDMLNSIYVTQLIPSTQLLISEVNLVSSTYAVVYTMLIGLESAIAHATAVLNAVTAPSSCCCCGGGFGGGCTASSCAPFASGGIVRRRTHAIVGEAGTEAIIPLAQLPDIIGNLTGGQGPTNIQICSPIAITVENSMGNQLNIQDLATQLSTYIAKQVPKKLLLGRNQ